MHQIVTAEALLPREGDDTDVTDLQWARIVELVLAPGTVHNFVTEIPSLCRLPSG